MLRCFVLKITYPGSDEPSFIVKETQNEALNAYVDALKQDAAVTVYRVRSSKPFMDSTA